MNLLDRIASLLSNEYIVNHFDREISYKVLRKTRKRIKLLINRKPTWFSKTDFLANRLAR